MDPAPRSVRTPDAELDALIADLPGLPVRPATDDEIATFRSDGVVVLRGVLPEEWIEVLSGPVDRVVGSGEAVDLGPMVVAAPDTPAFAGGVDHWRSDAVLEAFSLRSPLAPLVAALLGSERVHLWEDSVLVKEPGSPFPTYFHTDAGYFHLSGRQVCTTWVPLDPATAESGMVQWVRGSHLSDVEYRPNLFVTPEPIPGTLGEVVPDVLGTPALAERLVTFDVEPGDVTVHHARTLHGAPPNRSDRRRRAVSVRYTGDDVVYRHRPGLPGRPGLDEVSDGDPVGEPWCPLAWPRS